MPSPDRRAQFVVPILLGLIFPVEASSATIRVPADQPTIQMGVDSASPGDTVLVAPGVYHDCTHPLPGGHEMFCVQMKSGICLRSETREPGCAVVDADSLGRVIYCEDVDSTTTIMGFTLTGGYYTGDLGGGSGLYCVRSSPRLINVIIENNYASGYGGGMYCGGGSPWLSGCSFIDNVSYHDGGGLLATQSSPVLENCTFLHNSAHEDGGAIFCGACTLDVAGCVFSVNTAYRSGGGIYSPGSSLTLSDCSFSRNTASLRRGGGVYILGGSAALSGCTFFRNRGTLGGGLAQESSGSLLATDCDFTMNSADAGSALFLDGSAPVMIDCGFTGNSADYHGGAVYGGDSSSFSADGCAFTGNSAAFDGGALYFSQSVLSLTRCTLAENGAAGHGGAIDLIEASSGRMENTIIAFSTQGVPVSCDLTAGVTLVCCDLYGNAGGDWVGPISSQYGVDGNFASNPLFCDPPGGDYRLAANSPCASAGFCGRIGAFDVGCPNLAVEMTGMPALEGLHLLPNVPNPFGFYTVVRYCIPGEAPTSRVVISIYDATGREVTRLVDAERGSGMHEVRWSGTDRRGTDVASGVYFCRMTWNGGTRTRRIVLLK